MKVAMIPARGGSKRIKRKNIREFCGKPIIAYSIEAALHSGLFDQVIVSTDDEEIADVAKKHGAETPFIRPPELADDFCVLADVTQHTLDFYQQQNQAIKYLCCVYATAPMIDVNTIKRGLELVEGGAQSAMAVTTFPFPIQRALKVDESNNLSMMNSEYTNTRSQDLPEAYHDAAQFFWLNQNPSAQGNKAIMVDRHRVQDIDTEEDWLVAEQMYLAFKALAGQSL